LIESGLRDLLLRKEITTISCFLRVLLRMFSETEKDSSSRVEIAEKLLVLKCTEIISDYVRDAVDKDFHSKEVEVKRVISAYTPIIVQILRGFLDFYDNQFDKHLTLFYPLLNELMLTESRDIRQVLRSIFLRIGKIRSIIPPQ